MTLWRAVSAYFTTPDPRLALAFTVVIAVVGNQPFYPLYVGWIVGPAAAPALWTFVSTPFFAAVPALARRSPLAAKLLLLGAGIGNTGLCTAALGTDTGVQLFYLPCLVLSAVLFPPRIRIGAILLTLVATGILFGTMGVLAGSPFSPEQNRALARLHAVSVACLMILLAIRSWQLLLRPARARDA